jgi:hypothetical protein
MRFDVNLVRLQINNLLVQYPELAEDDVLRADCIEAETEAHEFLRAVETRRREAATMAGAIATNIAELELRQQRFVRREKSMRVLAQKVLEAAEVTAPIELPEATYSLRKVAPSVQITDESALPNIACKFERKPDKTKIKELLQTEPFLVTGACMSNGGVALSIRTK